MPILNPKHPLLILSAKFAELCKPLELFHINHVTYLKKFKDGTRIGLSNKPQWIEDYYNLKLYQSSLFEASPMQYQAEFGIWLGEYDIEVYQHGKNYYGTYHSITVTEPVKDGCEFFLFSVSRKHAQVIQYLGNNMDILYRFILYVKDRGASLFKSAANSRLILQNDRNFDLVDESLQPNKNYFQLMDNLKQQFYKGTSIHKYIFEQSNHAGIHLTQRELLCLSYLLQNKTAEETAKLMNISRRTVESYLDNIKIKLAIDTKADLVANLKSNRFLAALSQTVS